MTRDDARGISFLASVCRVLGRAFDTRLDIIFSPAGNGFLGEDGSGGKNGLFFFLGMRVVGLFLLFCWLCLSVTIIISITVSVIVTVSQYLSQCLCPCVCVYLPIWSFKLKFLVMVIPGPYSPSAVFDTTSPNLHWSRVRFLLPANLSTWHLLVLNSIFQIQLRINFSISLWRHWHETSSINLFFTVFLFVCKHIYKAGLMFDPKPLMRINILRAKTDPWSTPLVTRFHVS